MATQHRVSTSPGRQLPSRTNLSRQLPVVAATTSIPVARRAALLAASCLLLTAGACADEQEIDLATCGEPEVYRIDRVELPRSSAQVRELGLDLDRDDRAVPDNQLGMLIGVLDAALHFNAGEATSDRLAGEVAWDLAVRACGDREVVSLGRPESLDEVQLVGAGGAGVLSARGAGGEVPLSLLFDPEAVVADPGWLPGMAAAIELVREADGTGISARFGIALDADAVFEAFVPPVARFLETHEIEDPVVMQHLDRNRDGSITAEELRASTVVRSLLAPDLRIDGAPALSFGLGLSGARKP